MPPEAKHEYYRIKSFREVNPLVDAKVEKHMEMVGKHHNNNAMNLHKDRYEASSDEEDVDDKQGV